MSFSRAHLPKVVTSLEYWDARVLFYLSRIFTDQLKKGESYKKLKKCIHVSILGFIYFKEDDIINWMRFLGGKTRREFEAMAKKDKYIDEAYKELEKLSADEQAKLEYEAREKAIRDYNSQMNSALKRGMEEGFSQGEKQGKAELIRTMHQNGAEPELIARLTGLSLSEIQQIL